MSTSAMPPEPDTEAAPTQPAEAIELGQLAFDLFTEVTTP